MRKWKESLPPLTIMYLFAATRAASRASADTRSYSPDTMCTACEKSSTGYFFLPQSKMRIFGSGTPRQNRDFG